MTRASRDDGGRQERLSRVYQAGGDSGQLARHYDDWAERYDEDMVGLGYLNPSLACGLVGRHVGDEGARILDAGVGTGLIGRLLHLLGYRDLVGIDLSQGMLDRAAGLGAYRALRRMVLGEPLDFPDHAFDACVACGVLTVGHAPPQALDELVRVVRPAGVLIFSVTDEAFDAGGFGARIEALREAGAWQRVAVTDSYVPLPGAAAEAAHGSRMFVYRTASAGG